MRLETSSVRVSGLAIALTTALIALSSGARSQDFQARPDSPCADGESGGRIEAVIGVVYVYRGGSRRSAQLGDTLCRGDKIQTTPGAAVRVELAEGGIRAAQNGGAVFVGPIERGARAFEAITD